MAVTPLGSSIWVVCPPAPLNALLEAGLPYITQCDVGPVVRLTIAAKVAWHTEMYALTLIPVKLKD